MNHVSVALPGKRVMRTKKELAFDQEPLRTLGVCAEAMTLEARAVQRGYYSLNKRLYVNGRECYVTHITAHVVIRGIPYIRLRFGRYGAPPHIDFLLAYVDLNHEGERFRHVFCRPASDFASQDAMYIPLKGSLKDSGWDKYCDEQGLSLLK